MRLAVLGVAHRGSGPDIDSSVDFSVHRMFIFRSVLGLICVMGLALVLSWVGPHPIGGDPDLMYKPIKVNYPPLSPQASFHSGAIVLELVSHLLPKVMWQRFIRLIGSSTAFLTCIRLTLWQCGCTGLHWQRPPPMHAH